MEQNSLILRGIAQIRIQRTQGDIALLMTNNYWRSMTTKLLRLVHLHMILKLNFTIGSLNHQSIAKTI